MSMKHGEETVKKPFPASIDHLSRMIEFACEHAQAVGFPLLPLSHIELAMEEALVNIITHGYQNKKPEESMIHIECYALSDSGVKIIIRDSGVPFNPVAAARVINEPTIGGYGIFLIFRMMDKVEYFHEDGMNVLHLTKFHSK